MASLRNLKCVWLGFLAVFIFVQTGGAAKLVMGVRTGPAVDPHFLYLTTLLSKLDENIFKGY